MSVDDIISKARVLIEALPYIQSFRRKIVVVKYGGSTMTEQGEISSVLTDVIFMETVGMRPVIVHGGGEAISRRMKEEGLESKFVNGLRVTDAHTMEIVEDTLFGTVNREVVETIHRAGGNARGLSGKEKGILRVKKHMASVEDERGMTRREDIGFVGDVTSVAPEPIQALCEQDIIPVIAPIGLGEDGRSYNVNADTAAGEIAAALSAEKLVFLTDVRGIMRNAEDRDSLFSTLHVDAVDEMIKGEIITGGMIPKVRACLEAVRAGVRKTHIIDGRVPHSLLLEIFTDEGVGTQIIT